jgi:signal transduction histidine kinase
MPNAEAAILNDPKRVEALRRLCLLNTPADPAFDRLTRLAADILNAPISLVTLVDAEYQFFKSQVGLQEPWASARQTPLSHSFCQHTLTSNEPLIIENALSHHLVHDNLAIQDLDAHAYLGIPLTTSDGDAIGSFCVLDDKPRVWTTREINLLKDLSGSVMTEIELRHQLSEKAEIERELLESIEKQKELAELKTRFMAMVSHEFRTPLAIIQAVSDTLTSYRQKMSEEQELEKHRTIQKQVHILKKFLDDILIVSRSEIVALHFQPKETDFIDLCLQVITDSQQVSPLCQIQLSFTGEGRTAVVDTELMMQALSNLVSNAVKYSVEACKIWFEVSMEPETVTIHVRDNGIGISEDDQRHLFEAFYRAHNVNAIRGTGLGLTIVKRAVDAHSGSITFTSALNRGTTFIIHLPRHAK